jgi:hypothetical protein
MVEAHILVHGFGTCLRYMVGFISLMFWYLRVEAHH